MFFRRERDGPRPVWTGSWAPAEVHSLVAMVGVLPATPCSCHTLQPNTNATQHNCLDVPDAIYAAFESLTPQIIQNLFLKKKL